MITMYKVADNLQFVKRFFGFFSKIIDLVNMADLWYYSRIHNRYHDRLQRTLENYYSQRS
jgi:hypothetical protein